MTTGRHTRQGARLSRRRRWRSFRWLALLLLPPLIWFIANRIDEAPNADALRWGNPPERNVADAQNAWLYLLGIGAADGDDPVVHARRRVDAYIARARRDPDGEPDPQEDDRNDPIPYVGSVDGIDGFAQLCPRHESRCIDWATAHRPALQRQAQANSVRLQRLDAALALPQWQEAPLLSTNFPAPSMTLAALKANLLALDADDPSRLPAVADELARHAALWRRATEQGEWLLSRSFGFAFIGRYQRLLAELYERATPAQREAMQPALDSVFAAPAPAATNLDVVAYDGFQITVAGLRGATPGLWQSLGNCMRGTPENGTCGNDLLASATYLPQATSNIVAKLSTARAEFLAAGPADEAAAMQRYTQRIEREDPSRGAATFAAKAYNVTGRRLAFESIPEPVWRKHLNDHETLRRMLLIRIAAIRADIPHAQMPEFLATQPVELRHPYPGRSITWRPGLQALVAAAATERSFENDVIVVPYASPAPPPAPTLAPRITPRAARWMPRRRHGQSVATAAARTPSLMQPALRAPAATPAR
jgi:hypothetical protein